ncbi:SatD family protein [Aquirufa sp. ROCK-SH2]
MDFPILMADVINSGGRNPALLMQQLKDVVTTINKEKGANLISPLTITLGDEFQGLSNSMENGINTIFDIEEKIVHKQYNLKLRYVLYFGQIETEINNKIAYEMLGEGLTNARKELNSLKNKEVRFKIRLTKNELNKETYLNKAFSIYQNFVDSWKEKDLKIVKEFLLHEDYKTVAKNVNIDPSNAWRRKKSLNIHEYNHIKNIILFILNPNHE